MGVYIESIDLCYTEEFEDKDKSATWEDNSVSAFLCPVYEENTLYNQVYRILLYAIDLVDT